MASKSKTTSNKNVKPEGVIYHDDQTVSVYDPSIGKVVRGPRLSAYQKLWIGPAECEKVYTHTGRRPVGFNVFASK